MKKGMKLMKSVKSAAGVLPPPHDGLGRPHCVDPMSQMKRGVHEGELIVRDHSVCEYCNR